MKNILTIIYMQYVDSDRSAEKTLSADNIPTVYGTEVLLLSNNLMEGNPPVETKTCDFF